MLSWGKAVVVIVAYGFAYNAGYNVGGAAGVIEYFAGLVFGRALRGIKTHVAYLKEHVGSATGATVVFVPLQAAALVHQVVKGYAAAIVILPGGYRGRSIYVEFALLHQGANHRVGKAFGHRPAELQCVTVKAGGVTLGYDLAVVHYHDGAGMPCFLGPGSAKALSSTVRRAV